MSSAQVTVTKKVLHNRPNTISFQICCIIVNEKCGAANKFLLKGKKYEKVAFEGNPKYFFFQIINKNMLKILCNVRHCVIITVCGATFVNMMQIWTSVN